MTRAKTLGVVLLALAACDGAESVFLGVPGSGTERTMILAVDDRPPRLVDLEADVELHVEDVDDTAHVEALLYGEPWSTMAERLEVEPGALELVPASVTTAPLPRPDAVYVAALDSNMRAWRATAAASPALLERHVRARTACVPFDGTAALGTVGFFDSDERYTFAVELGDGALVGWPDRLAYVTTSGNVSEIQTSTIARIRTMTRYEPGGDLLAAGVDGRLYFANVRGERMLLNPSRRPPEGHFPTRLAARGIDFSPEAASIDKTSGSFVVSDGDGIREVHRFAPNDPRYHTDAVVLLFADDPRALAGLGTGGRGWIAAVPSDPEIAVFADGQTEVLQIGAPGFSAGTITGGELLLADVEGNYWRFREGEWTPIIGLGGAYILHLHPYPNGFVAGGILGRLQLWVENGGFCPSLMLTYSIENLVFGHDLLFTAGPVPNDRGMLDYAFVSIPGLAD